VFFNEQWKRKEKKQNSNYKNQITISQLAVNQKSNE
jgi:hypothetical protein